MKNILSILVCTAVISAVSARPPVKRYSLKSEQQKQLERKLKSIKLKHLQFDDEKSLAVFKFIRIESKKQDPTGKGGVILFSRILTRVRKMRPLSLTIFLFSM